MRSFLAILVLVCSLEVVANSEEDLPEISCEEISQEIENVFLKFHISNHPQLSYLLDEERLKKNVGYFLKSAANLDKNLSVPNDLFVDYQNGNCQGYYDFYKAHSQQANLSEGQFNFLLYRSILQSFDPHSKVISQTDVSHVEKSFYSQGSSNTVSKPFYFGHKGKLNALVRIHQFGMVEGAKKEDIKNNSTLAGYIRDKVLVKPLAVEHLIIDLRGNPGGRTIEAINLASLFSEEVKVKHIFVHPKLKKGHGEAFISPKTKNKVFDNVSLTILIDESSASAAELFAGILQDLGKAVILGERSFGKGTTFRPLERTLTANELKPGGLFVTNGYLILPSGRSVQAKGISPDIFFADNRVTTLREESSPSAIRKIKSNKDFRTMAQKIKKEILGSKLKRKKRELYLATPALPLGSLGMHPELVHKIGLAYHVQN